MITEEMYFLAKKIVEDYESQVLNKHCAKKARFIEKKPDDLFSIISHNKWYKKRWNGVNLFR